MISVDFPEPETPVTHVSRPSGISAVTLRRLLPLALTMRICFSGSGALRRRGTAMQRLPLKYCPVIEAGLDSISAGCPRRRCARRECPRRAPDRSHDPPRGSLPRRARRRSRCCRCRAALRACEQPLVVALMQADRRLIEDVHDAREAASPPGLRAGCAAPRRPTVSRRCDRASDNPDPTSARKRSRSATSFTILAATSPRHPLKESERKNSSACRHRQVSDLG